MGLSDLCPVTVLICLASMLGSESTVTDVARTQRLVRWGAIPADVDMFLSCFRVCFCRRGDCSTTLYFFVAGTLLTLLLDIETKIHVFKEFMLGIHVFTVGFVGVICQTTFMIFRSKGAANLIVTSPLKYSKEPTCLRWRFSDFHVPLYRNKRLCKTMQCGGFETDPRYPMPR